MGDLAPVFYEVFEALPRQGPGSRECTARALALCRGLPAAPRIVDFGGGAGAQTLDLAALTDGTIEAIDALASLVERLARVVAERGLTARVRPVVGDMAQPSFAPESVDLVWSEGAAYTIGIATALAAWQPLLRPGGHLAFSHVAWLRDDPPAELRAYWQREYPEIAAPEATIALAREAGFEVVGHFPLPAAAWWDDFYTPMEARVRDLRAVHAADAEALAVLDAIDEEIDMHRRFGEHYGYVFFVLRRPAA
ncbi:MAG: class I SAM-dependent methyltransferase [Vicinamibacteria bacterium]|nr:class I SAM-dependent methyltransferase [Vicinamibacteria bacterium]